MRRASAIGPRERRAPRPPSAARRGPPSPAVQERGFCRGARVGLIPQIFPEFLHSGEEAFGFGAGLVLVAGALEFLEQLLLALVEADRGLDHRFDIHVTARR